MPETPEEAQGGGVVAAPAASAAAPWAVLPFAAGPTAQGRRGVLLLLSQEEARMVTEFRQGSAADVDAAVSTWELLGDFVFLLLSGATVAEARALIEGEEPGDRIPGDVEQADRFLRAAVPAAELIAQEVREMRAYRQAAGPPPSNRPA